ncbi:MAG: T9SS type A sorting domain-containing protein [Candidatus Coatesbacteria bacterium]|nr:T9SS type A sorting domain-containing protein [Candidatus Coatesbacteria bacterium]
MRILIKILVGFSLLYGEHFWSAYHGNNRRDGLSSLPGPRSVKLLKTIEFKPGYNSCGVLSDENILYIAAMDHYLYAIKDGEIIWREQIFPDDDGFGFESALDPSGMLYLQELYGGYWCKILAYNPKTKTRIWETDRLEFGSLLVGDDNTIYFCHADKETYPYLIAIDRNTGKYDYLTRFDDKPTNIYSICYGKDRGIYYSDDVNWEYYDKKANIGVVYKNGDERTITGDFGDPAISKFKYGAIEGAIYSVNSDKSGYSLFCFVPGLYIVWVTPLYDDGGIYGFPAICPDGSVVVFSTSGYLYKISPAGKHIWKSENIYQGRELFFGYMTIDSEGKIYLPVWDCDKESKEGLYCLNSDGKILFFNNEFRYGYNVIICPDRKLYLIGVGAQTIYYIGEDTGFEENKTSKMLPENTSLSAYPNPFRDKLVIESKTEGIVYNITGQKLESFSKGKHSIDTSKWREGVYIVKAGKETKRVVKVRQI